jgi:putative spermidine/putrescine transport system permease protein
MVREVQGDHAILIRLLDALESLRAAVWPRAAHRFVPAAFLLPAVALVGLLAAGVLVLGEASLHRLDTETFETDAAWSRDNYVQVLWQPVTWIVLARSVGGAVVVTLVTLALAFPYAYVMVRTPHASVRKALLVGLFLPFFIGQVVRAYGWLILLGQDGLVNHVLGAIGVGPVRLLWSLPTVLFGLVQYMLPFAVLLIAPAVTAIDDEVERASESLGADWLRTFRHVVLPMARPGLVAAALVVFTLTLTDYAMPVVLGGGMHDFAANAVYDAFFRLSDSGLGAAWAVVLTSVATAAAGGLLVWAGTGTLGFRVRESATT